MQRIGATGRKATPRPANSRNAAFVRTGAPPALLPYTGHVPHLTSLPSTPGDDAPCVGSSGGPEGRALVPRLNEACS